MPEAQHWRIDAESLPLPTLRVALDGTVEDANAAAGGLFGLAPDDLRTRNLEQLLSAGGRILYHTQLIPTLRMAGRAAGLTLVMRDNAGAERRVMAYATLDPDPAPRVALMLMPTRDGSDMEDELLRIRRAADASPGMLFEYVVEESGRGRFAYASASLVTLLGLIPEQIRRDDDAFFHRVHPDDRAALLATRDASARTQALWSAKFRTRIEDDGAWTAMSWLATPRTQPNGAVVWHGLMTDVTRQREMEAAEREREAARREDEARREAEAFTRLVADSIPGRVAYWDPDHTCRFANSQFCRWLGRSHDEVLGRSSLELLGPERHGELAPWLALAFAGDPQHVEIEEPAEDDGKLHWHLILFPDLRDGQVRGVIILGTDISTLKRSEQRLRDLNEQLALALAHAEEATRSKSAFLANMSHEIRTPMNAIIGLTHLMARDSRDTLLRERLDKVGGAASHLLQIINDVLDLSKIEAGKMLLEDVEFDVDSLLTRAFDLVSDRARDKGLELVLDIDHVPKRLRGDPTRLSQALVNLLSNAVKFTARGWIRLRAELLQQDRDARLVRFEITDTG